VELQTGSQSSLKAHGPEERKNSQWTAQCCFYIIRTASVVSTTVCQYLEHGYGTSRLQRRTASLRAEDVSPMGFGPSGLGAIVVPVMSGLVQGSSRRDSSLLLRSSFPSRPTGSLMTSISALAARLDRKELALLADYYNANTASSISVNHSKGHSADRHYYCYLSFA
jgi:hypothetical protein